MPNKIHQNRVSVLPTIGKQGEIYYIENGQGTNVDQYISDNTGVLRLVGRVQLNNNDFNNNKIYVILGETINGGDVIYIRSNNKAYKYNSSDINLYSELGEAGFHFVKENIKELEINMTFVE